MAHDPQWFTDGTGYDRLMAGWTRTAGATFLDWLSPPSAARWLDVGCGTGVFTELVVETCSPATVIAIDPAAAQIEFARKKSVAQRVDFRIADAQTLPFADGTFDVVVSALVINFIPERLRALAEMRRVCAPGGVIAGYVWDFAAQRSPNAPLRFGLQEIGVSPPPVPGTEDSRPEALAALFTSAKLTDIAMRIIDVTISFTNFDDFWQSQTPSYNPVAKMLAALSEPDRERVLAIVRGSFPADSDGSVAHSARAHAIKARVPK
jgi:ubiquinone/menaquinone biosynthesis C-methylase UbiE